VTGDFGGVKDDDDVEANDGRGLGGRVAVDVEAKRVGRRMTGGRTCRTPRVF